MEWNYKELGDVCRLINGRAYKKTEMLAAGPYPLLRVGNFFTNREWYYSDLELDDDKYCDSGDLLYAWSASFGPRIWDGGKVIYHYHIWKVEIDQSEADKKYLFHLLDWDKERIKEEQGAGTTMVHVTKGAMEKRVLPFPPLPEQKRIVAILDKAFAAIDEAKAKTEQNLKNARELFDSYLQQVFSERGEGWKTSELKSITTKIGSGATPKGGKSAYKKEGISLIRSMNVHDRLFVEKDLAFIDNLQAEKLSNVVIEKDDVLLNITGASVARSCIAPEKYLPARVNQHVAIIRLNQKELLPKFLNYGLTSKYYKNQLLGIGEAGSTRQAITKAQIESFQFNYPLSLATQSDYIRKLEELESLVVRMEKLYQRKLLSLDELKKSILQKAFSGKLTANQAEEAVA